MITVLTAVWLAIGASPPISAPSAVRLDSDRTPTECLKQLTDERRALYLAAAKSGKKLTAQVQLAILDSAKSWARSCAKAFDVAKVPLSELEPLSRLYTEAGQDELSKAAIKRLAADGETVVVKAGALITLLGGTSPDSAEFDALFSKLDALGPKAAVQRMNAHWQAMNRSNRRNEAEQGAFERQHANLALAAALDLSEEDFRKQGSIVSEIYESVIRSARAVGETKRADSLFERAMAQLGPGGLKGLRQETLIGGSAPKLVATHWFNAPDGFKAYEPQGKVTLVMLTEHG